MPRTPVRRRARAALLACAAALACAPDLASLPVRYVGDLEGLERVRLAPWDEAYRRPRAHFAALRGVHVAPVAIADDVDTGGVLYRERDLERVRRRLELALAQSLEQAFPISRAGGSGVLRVEATIVALRSTLPPVPPPGFDASRSRGTGAAGVQIALRDARSGKLLMALRDRREAAALPLPATTWADAEWWFRYWSDALRDLLVRESGG
ncbi:MAG: DUF3313 family protein [Myxococcota bacterium]